MYFWLPEAHARCAYIQFCHLVAVPCVLSHTSRACWHTRTGDKTPSMMHRAATLEVPTCTCSIVTLLFESLNTIELAVELLPSER